MPRTARLDAPGGLHHLMIRGIERSTIFQDDRDRDHFLDRLGSLLVESATPCFAWALLPNHAHLLVRTGSVPLATLMRRLLTGYAVTYNRRHRRHGPLFQNRYKSILCQEDPYLLELVRYIHLNPLRAQIVPDLEGLEVFRYTGHPAVLGKRKNSWQDVDSILHLFDQKGTLARKRYRAFVHEGVEQGRRPDLVGGGLMRGLFGWAKTKASAQGFLRSKEDQRILGDERFAQEVLRASDEQLERAYRLRAKGYDLEKLAQRAANVCGMKPEEVWSAGKYSKTVQARSLLCYWAVRELGISATALARRLGLTQPAVSISVRRGGRIAKEKGLEVLE